MTKGERFAEQVLQPATAVFPKGGEGPGVEIGWVYPCKTGETFTHFILPIPDDLDPAVAIADMRKSLAEAYDRSLIY